jgi:transcriptional regulator with XRE-family HTH domain
LVEIFYLPLVTEIIYLTFIQILIECWVEVLVVMKSSLGALLTAKREEHRRTINEIASSIGIAGPCLKNYEEGAELPESLELRRKILSAYGVSESEFLEITGVKLEDSVKKRNLLPLIDAISKADIEILSEEDLMYLLGLFHRSENFDFDGRAIQTLVLLRRYQKS